MQVDNHSLTNNVVRSQLGLNLVDICLGSILKISSKSSLHFVSIQKKNSYRQNLTCKTFVVSFKLVYLNSHENLIILASESKIAYALFKTRKILKFKQRDSLCCL